MNTINLLSLRQLLGLAFTFSFILACKEPVKKSPAVAFPGKVDAANMAEISSVIHNFYAWYDVFLKHSSPNDDYLVVKDKHLTLDEAKYNAYCSKIAKSGFVSKEFFDKETAYFKQLEPIWAKENAEEELPTGIDSDRYFCAQDWELKDWTSSVHKATVIGNNKVSVSLAPSNDPESPLHRLELTKENGKWLISNFNCYMDLSTLDAGATVDSTELETKPFDDTKTVTTTIPTKGENISKKKPKTTPKTVKSVAKPPSVMVNDKGVVTISGKPVAWEDIRKVLQANLVQMHTIPNNVPITFDKKLLMGVRGEVRTEVEGAVAGAKWIRKKGSLDALMAPVAKELKIPLDYTVETYRTSGDFAFVVLKLKHKAGSPMDYAGTKYEKQYKLGGSISDEVWGLLKYQKGAWKILTHVLGPTDVPNVGWDKKYNAPKALFKE